MKSHHEQRGNNDSRCSGHKSHLTDKRRSCNPTSKSMEDDKSISFRRKDNSYLRNQKPTTTLRVDIRPNHLQEQRPVVQPGPSREHTSCQLFKDNSKRRLRFRNSKRQRDKVNSEKNERRRRYISKNCPQLKTLKFRGGTSAKRGLN